MAQRQWTGTTFGNGWMHKTLIRILRFVDVRFIYAVSDIFVVPFCVLFNHSGKTAYSFYRNRLHNNVLKSCWQTCRNHSMFSRVIIDRFSMYAGKEFDITIEGADYFRRLEAQDDGFVQLSSHIGNYEIAGYSLNSTKKGIHAIVYSSEKESVMNNRNSMFVRTNVSMIALKEDMSHLFEIDEALCRGDIISFPSDRHMEGARCISARFLGEDAKFPQGPFSVATLRGTEVLAVNVMKEGPKRYKIYLTPLPYDKEAPRKAQIQELCRKYVDELERMVHKYPEQWFNFYDFWA